MVFALVNCATVNQSLSKWNGSFSGTEIAHRREETFNHNMMTKKDSISINGTVQAYLLNRSGHIDGPRLAHEHHLQATQYSEAAGKQYSNDKAA